jgi:putative hydrolase of the HAD superfamily
MIEKVRHYFKHIFSPISDRNEIKKKPQMYEMICKILDTEPNKIAHVSDDWYSDFISPRKIGITSFHLDRTGKKSGKFVIRDLNELEDRLTTFQGI